MSKQIRQEPKFMRLLAFLCVPALVFGVASGDDVASKTVNKKHLKQTQDLVPEPDLFNVAKSLFKRGPRDVDEVCLTFDDGPHPVASPAILRVLRQHHVKATFFVVGERLAAHPEYVQEMLEEGHEVANHTMTHRRLDSMTEDQIRAEFEGCERAFEYTTGRRMTMMRPPGMRFNDTVVKVAKDLGYVTIDWNIGARDYYLPDPKDLDHDLDYEFKGSPTVVADLVLKQIKKGVIILLHENMTTARALPRIIRTLKREGYKFRTVTQMMSEIPGAPKIVANPPKED